MMSRLQVGGDACYTVCELGVSPARCCGFAGMRAVGIATGQWWHCKTGRLALSEQQVCDFS